MKNGTETIFSDGSQIKFLWSIRKVYKEYLQLQKYILQENALDSSKLLEQMMQKVKPNERLIRLYIMLLVINERFGEIPAYTDRLQKITYLNSQDEAFYKLALNAS